jgi:hypothetical protein
VRFFTVGKISHILRRKTTQYLPVVSSLIHRLRSYTLSGITGYGLGSFPSTVPFPATHSDYGVCLITPKTHPITKSTFSFFFPYSVFNARAAACCGGIINYQLIIINVCLFV